MKKNETYGIFNNDAMTAEDIYSYPYTHDPRSQAIKNNTYTLKGVTTTTNESCTYQDRFDSSNSIETKRNEAYMLWASPQRRMKLTNQSVERVMSMTISSSLAVTEGQTDNFSP